MRLPHFCFTVRHMMILVIFAGILVGGWVSRDRAKGYRKRADAFANEEPHWSQLVTMRQGFVAMAMKNVAAAKKNQELVNELKALGGHEPVLERNAEESLRNSEQRARDAKAELDEAKAMLAHCAAMKKKYDRAASRPWLLVGADPPPPDPETRVSFWLARRDYGRALAALDELLEREPSNAERHMHRAWIFATCPDPKHRDGKRAVESATRACELDRWKHSGSLDALAAAYAEAGDFEAAVRWQREALGRMPSTMPSSVFDDYKGRLRLYENAKPFRAEPFFIVGPTVP